MDYKLIKQIFDATDSHTMKFLIAISILVIFTYMPSALADSPIWQVDPLSLNDGGVYAGSFPVIINVTDASYAIGGLNDGGIDTITITITSTVDPTGITLTLTENTVNDGVFGNTNLIFMTGNDIFAVEDTATITIVDDDANTDSGLVETLVPPLSATVRSSSDPVGFSPTLTETGPDTGIFTTVIRFSTVATDAPTNTILVAGGDIISIQDDITAEAANGLIVPNPFAGIGAIQAEIAVASVTATYAGDPPTSLEIIDSGATGRGGGGLVRPGLVLDFVGAAGGDSGDTSPPSLTVSRSRIIGLILLDEVLDKILGADPFTVLEPLYDPTIDYPLSINENGFILSQYANTIQTFQANTGEPIQLKLNLFDSTGVEHIALYTNLYGYEKEIHNSDTYIIYDEGEPVEIVDPTGFFSNINFTISDEGTKYVVTYDMVFAKPMDTSDIIIRAWDQKRNSGDIKIFDAIKINGAQIVAPSPGTSVQTETTSMSIPYFKILKSTMPVADSSGKLSYYNSFGELEQKNAHPYYEPFHYPNNIGRAERHDDGFQNSVVMEDINARVLAQEIVGNPFTESEDKPIHHVYIYPSTVGKLDRENIVTLNDAMLVENAKATKIYFKRYSTNHLID